MLIHFQKMSLLKKSLKLLILMMIIEISSAQDEYCNGVFIVEPTQRLIREPLGAVVWLTCNTTRDDSLGLTWQVTVGGESTPTLFQQVLQTFDISLSGDLTNSTQLKIIGNQDNNGSICTCVTSIPRQEDGFVQCASELITVVFYDRPVAPINVTAVGTGVGSLLVSWSLANSEEVIENFTLTATNLNNADISTITVPGITGQNHTLFIGGTTSCDVYAFRVTAWNDVGTSPPSETITSIFPPLPDLSMVNLQHSLRKMSQERVEITVTFSPEIECSGYPNTYTLVVEDGSNVLTQSPESTGDVVSIVVNNLTENTRYSYYLIATNSFGSDNSTQTNLKTSDVQDVTICQVDNTQYFIQCIYLDGTDVGGCNYTFVAVKVGTENRTGYAERTDDGEIIQVDNIKLYSELVAYGSSNGSDENLAARASLNITRCPNTSTDDTTDTAGTTYYGGGSNFDEESGKKAAIGASVGVVAILGTLILTILILSCIKKNGYCTRYKVKLDSGGKSEAVLLSMNQSSNAPTHEEMLPRDYEVGYNILGKRIGSSGTTPTVTTIASETYAELKPQDQATQGGEVVASVEMVNGEPEYSTLTEATKAARSHSTQDTGDPVYFVLENPNERKQPNPDLLLTAYYQQQQQQQQGSSTASDVPPPPVPPYCPAGGDSPGRPAPEPPTLKGGQEMGEESILL